MRENMGLFKAKRTDNKGWVTGYFCYWYEEIDNGNKKPFASFQNSIRANEYRTYPAIMVVKRDIDGKVVSMTLHEVDPETVCECTGIPDVNNKPIYEGDIVKYEWYEFGNTEGEKYQKGFHSFIAPVVYYAPSFAVDHEDAEPLSESYDISRSYEVIGNIFDNPELLNTHDQ